MNEERGKIEKKTFFILFRFVFHDWRAENFPVSQLDAQVVFMTMSEEDCCVVKNEPEGNAIFGCRPLAVK